MAAQLKASTFFSLQQKNLVVKNITTYTVTPSGG
jgi:hypothetical protein